MDADSIELEHLPPDLGQRRLGPGPWSHERLRLGGLGEREGLDAEPLGQSDALDLSGRALGDLLDEHDPAWDLERGESRGGELPQLPLRHRGARPTNDRRDHVLAQPRVGDRARHDIRHCGVLQQHLVDLAR